MSSKELDANEIGAKLIKAELMGDEDLVKELKEKLEKLQKSQTGQKRNHDEGSFNDRKQHKNHNSKRSSHTNQDHGASGSSKNNKKLKKTDKTIETKIFQTEEKAAKKAEETKEKNEEKEENNCQVCLENAQKHLVVSIGKYCYLSLPATQSIVEGSCLIIPNNHCCSSVTTDEEVWSEIQEYKKCLIRMFDSKNMECVFFEHYGLHKKYSHMTIECIPLGRDVSNLAPIYFKKAINESESEWAQNKNIIQLKSSNIRKAIPRNMPYFCVEFGIDDGYAHVIENNDNFPDYFAQEVIGGILDMDDPLFWRRPKRDEFSAQSKKVLEFLKWWKQYDLVKK